MDLPEPTSADMSYFQDLFNELEGDFDMFPAVTPTGFDVAAAAAAVQGPPALEPADDAEPIPMQSQMSASAAVIRPTTTDTTATRKRKVSKRSPLTAQHKSVTEAPPKSRRAAHNLAEQRRSQRINSSIEALGTVLDEEMGLSGPKRTKAAILQQTLELVERLREENDVLASQVKTLSATTTPKNVESPLNMSLDASNLVMPDLFATLTQPGLGVSSLNAQGHMPLHENVPTLPAETFSGSSTQSAEFAELFRQAPVAAAVYSLDGNIEQANTLFEGMVGKPNVVNTPLFANLTMETLQNAFRVIGELLENKDGRVVTWEAGINTPTGIFQTTAHTRVLMGSNGEPERFSTSFVPV